MIYTYEVSAGEFSITFKAPLLGKEGSSFMIYDFQGDEVVELQEIKIHTINKKSEIIECTSKI